MMMMNDDAFCAPEQNTLSVPLWRAILDDIFMAFSKNWLFFSKVGHVF